MKAIGMDVPAHLQAEQVAVLRELLHAIDTRPRMAGEDAYLEKLKAATAAARRG